MFKNINIKSVFICSLLTTTSSMAMEKEYFKSEPPGEAKYLYVTVKNSSAVNTFTINGVNMGGGETHDVPKAGTKIPPREIASFVFRQTDFPNFRGPEANIEIAGKGGTFFLYAQQNYCLLESGKITARYRYVPEFTDIEGGTLIDGVIKSAGEDVHSAEGAYGKSFGKVSFQLQERRKGQSGEAPKGWDF